MERIKATPVLGPLVSWADEHPRLAAWAVLAIGFAIILIISARDVGLLAGQWAALIAASTLVAGLCIWIISWEDEDEEGGVDTQVDPDATMPVSPREIPKEGLPPTPTTED